MSTESSPSSSSSYLLTQFTKWLTVHQMEHQVKDSIICLAANNVILKPVLASTTKNQRYFSVQLNTFAHKNEVQIIEACVGGGLALPLAISEAAKTYLDNVLPVILLHWHCIDRFPTVETLTWQIQKQSATVYFGPIVTRNYDAYLSSPTDCGFDWLQALQRVCEHHLLLQSSCWLRFCYVHDQNQTQACELLVNNEPFEIGQDLMRSYHWPESDSYYSVRVFFTIELEEKPQAFSFECTSTS